MLVVRDRIIPKKLRGYFTQNFFIEFFARHFWRYKIKFGSWDHHVSYPNVFSWDGKYYQYYDGHGPGWLTNEKGYATTKKIGTVWNKYGGNPTFSPTGNLEDWDGAGVSWGDIINVDGLFYMFYCGWNHERMHLNGIATSPDLIIWSRHPANPILIPTQPWEKGLGLSGPAILKELDGITPLKVGGRYWIIYTTHRDVGKSAGQIGLASSADLVKWTKDAGNPILTNGGPGDWDEKAMWTPCFVRDRDLYCVFYQGSDHSQWRIGYAISPDLSIWTKYAGNPVLSSPVGLQGSSNVVDPVLRKFNGVYYLFYSRQREDGRFANEFATASDLISPWIKLPIFNVGRKKRK